jgi:ABC-type bacteriocin/lantibiotic exporter with double-glycine peptidase domain
LKKIFINTWAVLFPKERKKFISLVIADVIVSVLDILSLFFLLWIVQFYIQPEGVKQLKFLPAWVADRNSILFIALFVVMFSLKNIIAWLITKAHYKFSGDVAIRISENNLVRYQQGSFDEFVHIDSSEQIRKIAFQPFEFCQHILSGIQQMITQVLLVAITIIAIGTLNPTLFLLLICVLLPPVVVVFYFVKAALVKTKSHISSSNETSYRYLFDALKGYVEGNIFNRNKFFLQRFVRARRQFSTHLFDTLSLQTLPSRIIEIFAVLGLFVLIAIAKWTGDTNNATFITIGAFMVAAYKIIPGLVKLINLTGQVKAHELSLADFAKDKWKDDTMEMPAKEIHSIRLKDVSFQYNGHPMLDDFSLCMKKGEFIGIKGKSGKGKTTLLNLLLGFLPQRAGDLIFNEETTDQQDIKSYWPSMAYVRQQNFLIHDTVLKNITLEENEHDEKRMAYALKTSGLDEVLKEFPEGIQKIIAENGKNISGGQQQRIVLARALYKNADLILLDEPFSELDESSEIKLLQHFRDIAASGKIVVIITHNQQSLRYCTKTVSLDEA